MIDVSGYWGVSYCSETKKPPEGGFFEG